MTTVPEKEKPTGVQTEYVILERQKNTPSVSTTSSTKEPFYLWAEVARKKAAGTRNGARRIYEINGFSAEIL